MVDILLDADRKAFAAEVRRQVRMAIDSNDPATAQNGDHGPQLELKTLASLGLTGLGLPEEAGGSDALAIDLCLAAEELGFGGISTPLATSTALAGQVLVRAKGSSVGRAISAIIAGESVATVAFMRPGATSEFAWEPAPVTPTESGWSLTAQWTHVSYAHLADWLLLPVDIPGRGAALALLRPATMPDNAVQVRLQRLIGGEPRGAVNFLNAPVAVGDLLEFDVNTHSVIDDMLVRGSLVHTAHAVGVVEGALQIAVDWAKTRQQFGRPIGSFQTVSNRLADIRIAVDPARLLAWEAAWALGADRPDAATLVSVAKGFLSEKVPSIVTNLHQVLGAIGYSTEHPLHVHTRILKGFQNTFGSAELHLQRAAAEFNL